MSRDEQDLPQEADPTQSVSPNSESEGTVPAADHSRWMTEIWPEIADMSLQYLALPGTHNSGADMARLWGAEELLAACQDDTFEYQLNNGARVFDLRIEDFSYNKPVGRNGTKLVEIVGFEHMIPTGRYLQDCVETIRRFATNNPKELITLYIQSYKPGKVKDSIARCHRYLAPLNHLLIPVSAKRLALREINAIHPGKNVIICGPEIIHSPSYWPRENGFNRQWAGEDSSLSNLTRFTKKTFYEIEIGELWSRWHPWIFYAHARNAFGPMRLTSSSSYFTDFFDENNKLGTLANIIVVDFLKGTGVVDFCIRTNKKRGVQFSTPNIPTGLSAIQIADTEQVQLNWNPSTNIMISHYEVSINDVTTSTPHNATCIVKTLNPGICRFKVRAVSLGGKHSDYSSEIILEVKDFTPPSTPGDLKLTDVKMTSAKLEWKASHDYSGTKRYEIKCNGIVHGHTDRLSYLISSLEPSTEYEIEVRAEDNAGIYSRPASTTLDRRPGQPVAPSIVMEQLDLSGRHLITLHWKEPHSSSLNYDYQVTRPGENTALPNKHDLKLTTLVDKNAPTTFEISARLAGNKDLSTPLIHTVTIDATPPSAVTNLTGKIISNTSLEITWSPASGNVAAYAISFTEAPPIYIPAPTCRFTADIGNADVGGIFEVWAINEYGIPGELTIASATHGEPPKNVKFKHVGGIGTLTWSLDTVAGTTYEILVNDQPLTEVNGSFSAHFRLSDVPPGPLYSMKIRALRGTFYSEYAILEETVDDSSCPSNPGHPIATNVTENSATMTWTPSNSNQPLKGYNVSVNGLFLGIVPDTSYSLRSLVGGVQYLFTVCAQDISGNISDLMLGGFKTLGDSPMLPPGKPQNVRVTSKTADSISLAWDKGQGAGVAIQYVITSDDGLSGGKTLGTAINLKDLNPGLQYTFKIQGYDIFQQLSEPAEITVTTSFPPYSSE